MTEGMPGTTVMVEVSAELLAELRNGWSPPVLVMIQIDGRGGYIMTAHRHECPPVPAPSDLGDE